jgi:hypothetical protein
MEARPKVLVFKKFSNGVKFKNSFKKVLKIKKSYPSRHVAKQREGQGGLFPWLIHGGMLTCTTMKPKRANL